MPKEYIRNTSIHYIEVGSGIPIVMIHGYGVDHRVMLGCMEPIFIDHQGYKRIYIDLPGMGRSETSRYVRNADDMINLVIDFIKYLLGDEAFLIAGQSYGGYLCRGVAKYFIDKKPNAFLGMLLIGPVIEPITDNRHVPVHQTLLADQELLQKLPPESAQEFSEMFVVQTERIFSRSVNELESGFELADWQFLNKYRDHGYNCTYDVDGLSRPCHSPCLFLFGRQDSVVGFSDGFKLLRLYPRASYMILDMAGHTLQLEQEEIFNQLVDDWLHRVELFLLN